MGSISFTLWGMGFRKLLKKSVVEFHLMRKPTHKVKLWRGTGATVIWITTSERQ